MLCLTIVLYIILVSLSTQRDVLYKKNCHYALCDNPEECSSQLLHGGTLKFLVARRHKYHTSTFLVCTTHWPLTNNILLLELPPTRALQLVPILLPVPKSLLHSIPITATAQGLHHAQYLQLHKISHGPNDSHNPPTKQIPAHYIIWS